jgi:hypothetical protein
MGEEATASQSVPAERPLMPEQGIGRVLRYESQSHLENLTNALNQLASQQAIYDLAKLIQVHKVPAGCAITCTHRCIGQPIRRGCRSKPPLAAQTHRHRRSRTHCVAVCRWSRCCRRRRQSSPFSSTSAIDQIK